MSCECVSCLCDFQIQLCCFNRSVVKNTPTDLPIYGFKFLTRGNSAKKQVVEIGTDGDSVIVTNTAPFPIQGKLTSAFQPGFRYADIIVVTGLSLCVILGRVNCVHGIDQVAVQQIDICTRPFFGGGSDVFLNGYLTGIFFVSNLCSDRCSSGFLCSYQSFAWHLWQPIFCRRTS